MSFAQEAGGVAKVRAAHRRKTTPKVKGQKVLELKGGRTKANAKPRAKGTGKRQANNLYETPVEGTMALVNRYRDRLSELDYWDPGAGRRKLLNVLERQLPGQTFATDLVDYGLGYGGQDFMVTGWPETADPDRTAVIMNPPFSDKDDTDGGLAARFIKRAVVELDAPFVAVMVKAGFWHAGIRQSLFREWPPTRIHPLAFRLDFLDLGSPAMEMLWCVWDRRDPGRFGHFPPYEPLQRPRMGADFDLFGEAQP